MKQHTKSIKLCKRIHSNCYPQFAASLKNCIYFYFFISKDVNVYLLIHSLLLGLGLLFFSLSMSPLLVIPQKFFLLFYNIHHYRQCTVYFLQIQNFKTFAHQSKYKFLLDLYMVPKICAVTFLMLIGFFWNFQSIKISCRKNIIYLYFLYCITLKLHEFK